jgi:hypothetical protein
MGSTGETQFSLVYGAKAVLPTKLKYGYPQISSYDKHKLGEDQLDDVNFLEEIRSWAIVRFARYLQGLRCY